MGNVTSGSDVQFVPITFKDPRYIVSLKRDCTDSEGNPLWELNASRLFGFILGTGNRYYPAVFTSEGCLGSVNSKPYNGTEGYLIIRGIELSRLRLTCTRKFSEDYRGYYEKRELQQPEITVKIFLKEVGFIADAESDKIPDKFLITIDPFL